MRLTALALFCALHLPLAAQWPERGRSADRLAGYRLAERLDGLIDEGQYREASDVYRSALERAKPLEYDVEDVLPVGAKLCTEVGALQKAALLLKRAEALPGQRATYFVAMLATKRAPLLLSLGDYDGAAQAAAEAYRPWSTSRTIWVAFRKSIEAEARLRLGDLPAAEGLVKSALEIAKKLDKLRPFFYAPRVFYAACLVESYGTSPGDAEAECRRGIALAEGTGGVRRDISLGYLDLAEARLRASNLPGAREAALYSLRLTHQMFGRQHQDVVRALQMLAQMNLKEGKPEAARSNAEEAVSTALAVFGDGSLKMAELRRELAPCLNSPQ